MRLKKIKNAENIINKSPYVVSEPRLYHGNWQTIFANNNPICIEIGMGKGDFIIELARLNPHINYIGLEKYDSVLVKAIQKLEDIQFNNLKLINMDAVEITEVFNKEIDTIYLNFSDPWPKKRHHKRRLTSSIFLNKYEQIFMKDKHIIMKTDNRDLYEYSLINITKQGYYIADMTLDLYANVKKHNIQTEYEKKFVEQGKSIYQAEFIKELHIFDINN